MAVAPSSEDYGVLEEEVVVLSPDGSAAVSTGPETEESPAKATPAAAEAPGPSSDGEDSGASAGATRSSLVAAVIVAAMSTVAAF
jgi:hypothetical protein